MTFSQIVEVEVDRDNFFIPYKSWLLFIALFKKGATIKHITFASRCSPSDITHILHRTMRLTELMSPLFTGWLTWIGGHGLVDVDQRRMSKVLVEGSVGGAHILLSVRISFSQFCRERFFFTLH